MDKKNSHKTGKLPSFSWGGNNPLWENEASIIADQKEKEINIKKHKLADKNKHYYLRDYN